MYTYFKTETDAAQNLIDDLRILSEKNMRVRG